MDSSSTGSAERGESESVLTGQMAGTCLPARCSDEEEEGLGFTGFLHHTWCFCR